VNTRKGLARGAIGLVVAVGLATLSGCAAVVVGGAMVGTAIVATDRRSAGIQFEDEAIESRINRVLAARYPRGTLNVNVVSYNRRVLLVGQVTEAAMRDEIVQIADKTENVRTVLNEMTVGPLSSLGTRTNDTAISARVRAALLEARDVPTGATSVTTEGGVVYLMGRVTEAEGQLIARTAARVQGVQQVVKVFDYLTPEELSAMRTQTGQPESPRRP